MRARLRACPRRATRRIARRPAGRLPVVLLLACGLGAGVFLTARAAPYRLRAWTSDDGLPQNSVNAILQTRDGYLWFTTSDGLVRYDGVRFEVFDKSRTPGIGSNRFQALYEDADGRLWAGTEDGGLTRYEGGKFTTYTTRDGLPDNQIRAIVGGAGGHMLVVTRRGAVRWAQDKFVSFAPGDEEIKTYLAYPSRSGGLWYNSPGGLRRVEVSGAVTTYAEGPPRQPTTLCEDARGDLWIGMDGAGLRRLRGDASRTYGARDGLPAAEVRTAYAEPSGRVWFGTKGGGLFVHEGERFTTLIAPGAEASKTILSIHKDREGTLWLGTINGGLNRLSRDLVTVYARGEGLLDDTFVYPIYEDRAGTVWVGTWQAGLFKFENGSFRNYTRGHGGPRLYITALAEDAEGRLWVGSLGGAGWYSGGSYTDATALLGLRGMTVQVIRQTRDGAIWFGTKTGLLRRDREGNNRLYLTRDGLAGDEITDILEDRRGGVWFATSGGVSRLDGDGFSSLTESDGLSSNRVRTLHEDPDGTLWIGTYDGGLNRLRDGRLTRYTTAQGLSSNGVFRILEDDRGNFWMSSNKGVSRVARRQLEDYAAGKIRAVISVSYGKEDGLVSTECNGGKQPAGIRSRDGRLWFPTQGGVAVIDPEQVTRNSLAPPVRIEECLIDRAAVGLGAGTVVRLEPGKDNLEIRYTGLSFVKPEEVKFRYKLAGLDRDWVEAGTRRTAYYSYLPPGEYLFTVAAANSDGVWNEAGTSVRVVVVPPFYRTWWFYTLGALGVSTLAALVYERRISRLKRAQRAQAAFSRQLIESQEGERKRIAAELHDSIGQSLAIIKNRAALSLSQPADHEHALEQLDEISDAATHAIEEVREIAYNLRPLQLDQLGLRRSLESMLRKSSGPGGLNVSYRVDDIDGLLEPKQEINLYRIVQEGIGNIIKHAGATEAHVSVTRDDGVIRLAVRDNGVGFTPGEDGAGAARQGFGLRGIRERARMLGGHPLIRSAPGRGTVIRVRIAVGKQPNGN